MAGFFSREILSQFNLDPSMFEEQPKTALNDPESCVECGGGLRIDGNRSICEECGVVNEDVEDFRPTRTPQRLQLVGPRKEYYQRDLDRSGSPDYHHQQYESIKREYTQLNVDFVTSGRNGFTDETIIAACRLFNSLQRQGIVVRSQRKRATMAACLQKACQDLGIYRKPQDISAMVALESGGVSRGVDIIREAKNELEFDFDLDQDTIRPMAMTALAKCAALRRGLGTFDCESTLDEKIVNAVCDVVKYSEEVNIGSDSKPYSKVIASLSEVFRRAGISIDAKDMAPVCDIRHATILKFIANLGEFHSHFAPIYAKYGFDSERRSEG